MNFISQIQNTTATKACSLLLIIGGVSGLSYANSQDYKQIHQDIKQIVQWIKKSPDTTHTILILDNIMTGEQTGLTKVYKKKVKLGDRTFLLEYHDNNQEDPGKSSDDSIGPEDELGIMINGRMPWKDEGLNGFINKEEGDFATGVPGIGLRKNKPNQWNEAETKKVHDYYMNNIIKPLKSHIPRTTHK